MARFRVGGILGLFDCDVSVYSYDGDTFGINGSINTNMWRVSKPNQKQEKIKHFILNADISLEDFHYAG